MLTILYFYIFAVSILTATILVPFVSRLSVRVGGVDEPGERKIHAQSIPRLGGIAIFCSLLFTTIFFCDINQTVKGFLAGAIIIFLTGLADDLANLSARQKFAGEFLAAGLAVFMGGICVRHLGNPFGLGTIELGLLAIPFTIVGIVGLMNAVNLLDGLDGLAGGVCTIACVSFAVISFTSGNKTLFPLTIALMGALLGFLRYNNFPAIIFMGDSGSLLLGYCMGTFSVLAASAGNPSVSPYIPLVIMGLPILDTLVVMVNRRLAGKRLFQADKTHLHHRLLDLGIGHKFTVLIVFGISYLLSLIAIFGRNLSDAVLVILLITTAAGVYALLRYMTSSVRRDFFDYSSNQPLRSTTAYRGLVRLTTYLVVAIKALLFAILLLPLFLSHDDISILTAIPFLLLVTASVVFYLAKSSWRDALLRGYIYLGGSYMVFILSNYGEDEFLLGFSLTHVSHLLFFLLSLCAGLKIFIRKRVAHLIVFPFEYLIMLVVLSVPLLPPAFTSHYHLMTVAAKSLILFVGFKLVLSHQQRRNRKIILAIALTSLGLILRYASNI